MKGMLAVLACAASLLWAGKVVYENYWLDPTSKAMLTLRAGDADHRRFAVRQLARVNPNEQARVLPALVVALKKDKQGDIRAGAAESILDGVWASISSGSNNAEATAAANALFESLADSDPEVRGASARVISALEHRIHDLVRSTKLAHAPPYLNEARCSGVFFGLLSDSSDSVRVVALTALGDEASRDSKAPPAQVVAALTDAAPSVRAAAARSLPNYREQLDALVPALFKGLETSDVVVTDAFSAALARIRPPASMIPMLTQGLSSPHRAVRLRAADGLGRLGSKSLPAVPGLIELLHEPANTDPRSKLAQAPLGGVQAADTTDPAIAAAQALSKLCPRTEQAASAVAGLSELVHSPDDTRSAAAADALANFGAEAKSALPALIAELQKANSSDKPSVRGARCARAVGQIASRAETDAGAIAALTDALDSRDPDIKTEAATALARFGKGATGAIPKLRGLLGESSFSTKSAAAKALNALGEKTEVPKRPRSGR
jgi:HEAT repeat protein